MESHERGREPWLRKEDPWVAYPAEVVIVRGEPNVFPTVSLLFQILYRFFLVSLLFRSLPSSLSGFRPQFLWIATAPLLILIALYLYKIAHEMYNKISPFVQTSKRSSYVEKEEKRKRNVRRNRKFCNRNSFRIRRKSMPFESVFDSSRYLDRSPRYKSSKFS